MYNYWHHIASPRVWRTVVLAQRGNYKNVLKTDARRICTQHRHGGNDRQSTDLEDSILSRKHSWNVRGPARADSNQCDPDDDVDIWLNPCALKPPKKWSEPVYHPYMWVRILFTWPGGSASVLRQFSILSQICHAIFIVREIELMHISPMDVMELEFDVLHAFQPTALAYPPGDVNRIRTHV
jgi:hypothetical protein